MTEVVIVRHAQSTWNAIGRWQGWADPPLSTLGEAQATAAGGMLAAMTTGVRQFVASDLQRARRTAELLRAGQPVRPEPVVVDPVVAEPDLREYDSGEWTGLRRTEIAERWPGQLERWASGDLPGPPGGEDAGRFLARILDALGRVHDRMPEGLVVVVSHGRAIHALSTSLGAPPTRIENLSGWRLRLDPLPELLGAVSLLDPTMVGGSPAAGVGPTGYVPET